MYTVVASLVFFAIIHFVFFREDAPSTASQVSPAGVESRPTPTMKRGQTYKFPEDPVLIRLLSSSHHQVKSPETIIDDAGGFQKSYPELLGDILQTAHLVRTASPPSMLDERGLLKNDSPYIGVLVRSGYEFIVAFFAIRAMGGACMPIGRWLLFFTQAIFTGLDGRSADG